MREWILFITVFVASDVFECIRNSAVISSYYILSLKKYVSFERFGVEFSE